MTLPIQHFDTDAMRQISSYRVREAGPGIDEFAQSVIVERSVWNTLVADHLAAAEHIDELEFALKQRAA